MTVRDPLTELRERSTIDFHGEQVAVSVADLTALLDIAEAAREADFDKLDVALARLAPKEETE